LPELSLAFEYQGEPHYFPVSIYHGTNKRKYNDQRKKELSYDIGITLICVPFWWDKSVEALATMIREVRKDIDLGNFTPKLTPRFPPLDKIRLKDKESYIANAASNSFDFQSQ